MLRLDYLSCILTIVSTVLIGRRKWQGWIVAGLNSIVISVIGMRTDQTGFIPANLFCIAIYGYNIVQWRNAGRAENSCSVAASDEPEVHASITHVPRRFVRRLRRVYAGDDRLSRSSDRIRQLSLPHQR
jgi:hypothetical protein